MPDTPDPYLALLPDSNRDALANPRVKSFLDKISKSEGADYNTLVGGRKIDDLSRHPNVVGLRTRAGPSTAFGRYQITGTTNKSKLAKYAHLDYSPENQDLRAVELLRQTGALEALEKDDEPTAIRRAGKEWASIPGSPLPGRKNHAAFGQSQQESDPYLAPLSSAGTKVIELDDPYLAPLNSVAPKETIAHTRFGATRAPVKPNRGAGRQQLEVTGSIGGLRTSQGPKRMARTSITGLPIAEIQKPETASIVGVDAAISAGRRREGGVGALRMLDDPEVARRGQIASRMTREQAAANRTGLPGLPAYDMGHMSPVERENAISERVRVERAQEAEDAKQAEQYRIDKPEIDRLTNQYRTALKASGMKFGSTKWTAEMLGNGVAPLLGKFAGLGRASGAPGTEYSADILRIHAEALREAAEAEGADRNKASKVVQHVMSGFIETAPELALMSVGVPAPLVFGAGAGVEAYGMRKPVVPATVQGIGTGFAFETPGVGKGVTRAVTEGLGTGVATGGIELAAGASPEQALEGGLTNAIMRGAPGVKKAIGERNAKRADSEVRDVRSARVAEGSNVPVESPQKFQHLQFGEVEVTPDQSGARSGRIKVAEVNNPEAIHYVKRSDMQGRGNSRMIPIKESASEPVETSVIPTRVRQQETASQEQTVSSPTLARPSAESGVYGPTSGSERMRAEFDRRKTPRVSQPETTSIEPVNKAVDRGGQLLDAFHGTRKGFEAFAIPDGDTNSPRGLGAWFSTKSDSRAYEEGNAEYTAGIFAGEKPSGEFPEGANVRKAQLDVKNPAEFEDYDDLREAMRGKTAKAFRQELQQQGHDGVVIRGSTTDGGQYRDDWIVFSPEQVKESQSPSRQTETAGTAARQPIEPVSQNQRLGDENQPSRDATLLPREIDAPLTREAGNHVVDEKGDPLVVHHGTSKDFAGFDPSMLGSNTGIESAKGGFFFVSNPDATTSYAKGEAGRTISAHLEIKNPKVVKFDQREAFSGIADMIAKAKTEGRDGLILRDWHEGGSKGFAGTDIYVPFDAEQIRPIDQPSSSKVASPTTLNAENALVPDTEIPKSVSPTSTKQGAVVFDSARGRRAVDLPDAPARGMVRVYRGEPVPSQESYGTRTVKDAPDELRGRWFITDPQEAADYAAANDVKGGGLTYIDVPASEIANYKAKVVAGSQKFPFPLRDSEFILPSELAQKAIGIPSRAALESETSRPYQSSKPTERGVQNESTALRGELGATPTKRRDESKKSLAQAVRAAGGIKLDIDTANRGELARLSQREAATSGLVNNKGGTNAEMMAMQLAADGYRGDWVEVTMGAHGPKFDVDGNKFMEAVENDQRGITKSYSGEHDFDFEKGYKQHVETQIKDEKERRTAEQHADRLVNLIEGGRGGELFDKITANEATPAEHQELRSLARKSFVRFSEVEDLISEAKAEGLSTAFEGDVQAPRGKPEQLGFVSEGLEQQSAQPKSTSQRDALIRAEQERQRTTNPEKTAALETLARLREKGMTVDDYARQGSLTGETPRPEKLAMLRRLESGEKFGPGAASAKEPFPEVKERKFGTRFVEDERIVKELRDSIGTAKYYEVAPNKITAEQAKTFVEEKGLGESWNVVRDEANGMPFHVRSAVGQGVILRLNRAYKSLKETNPKAAEYALDRATDMAEWQMEYGTRLGQGVQSFAMWAKLSPEGKLLTYKRAVDKARQRVSPEIRGEVKEIVDTINEPMTREERVDELKKLFTTNKTARKVRSQMDKLIEAAKDGKLTDTLFYDVVGDRVGLPKYNKEIASEITKRALAIEDAPEGMPRDQKVFELNKYIAEQKGFGPSDLPIGIYYGNILSGYNTHIVNTVDTALNVISEINGLAMTNPRAAAKIYGGLLRGFADGKLDAISALTKGRMVTDGKWMEVPKLMELAKFGKKGGVPISTETRAGRLTKAVAETPIAYPLNAYKYVTRLLAASDAVFFRSAKEARVSLLAYRMAKAEGLSGDALDIKIREILALDRRADFLKQAEREGFTGIEAQTRAAELVDMVRNKDITSDAAEFAGEATYNHKPHGALGYASEVIGNWAQKYKALKLFVPFTRIVANVTNRGLNYTPYGYKRAFMGYSHGEALTPEGRRLMITRATVGTVGLVALGAMQEAGLIQIHGAGPSDKEKKRQLQVAGWRPYTIQMGNTYVSYVYTPVGLGLSIVGNMSDSQRYHEMEQKDAATRGAYAVARLGSTVFSQSFLSGLSRLFNALSESPNESVTAVKQTLSSTVSAATTPNLARDVYRLFDNKTYQSNTLMEDLIRNTPFAGLALKPTLNAFGEPVRVQRQRFFDVMTSDPAWKFVTEKGLRVPVPSRSTEMEKGTRISPEQYYQLLSTTGPKLKEWVVANRVRLARMKEDDAQDELQNAATRIRKVELARMRILALRKAS